MRATLSAGVLFGLIAAAAAAPVPKDDAPPPVTEKHLKASLQNLKELGLAFHNHHDATNFFPTDILDKTGKPLLSWRVAILPYIEEDVLYRQFKLNEPWDSEHNKKLVEKMPKVYAPIRVRGKLGETFYQTFTGTDAVFGGKMKNPTILAITDGTSNTAMVVEAGTSVVWTKPADIPFDAKKAVPKLGGMFDGECHVLRCDGSVFLMKKNPDEDELKKLVMPNDGLLFDPAKLEK